MLNTLFCSHLCSPGGVAGCAFKLGQQLSSHWAHFVFHGLSALSHRGTITRQIGGLKRDGQQTRSHNISRVFFIVVKFELTSSLETNLLQITAEFPPPFVNGICTVWLLFILKVQNTEIRLNLQQSEEGQKKSHVYWIVCSLRLI